MLAMADELYPRESCKSKKEEKIDEEIENEEAKTMEAHDSSFEASSPRGQSMTPHPLLGLRSARAVFWTAHVVSCVFRPSSRSSCILLQKPEHITLIEIGI